MGALQTNAASPEARTPYERAVDEARQQRIDEVDAARRRFDEAVRLAGAEFNRAESESFARYVAAETAARDLSRPTDEVPRWPHDFDCCTFLGRHGEADLYGCDKTGDAHLREGGVVFIARYSGEPSDYTSNPPRSPFLEQEAKRRWEAWKMRTGEKRDA